MDKLILDSRIKHMHGVAEYMYNNAEKYNLNKDEMYILGLLHDIGYINGKDNHEWYGGKILNQSGYINAKYVYWHGTTPEDYKRANSCMNENIPKPLILLWEADLSVDQTGENVGFDKRLEDIGNRHGYDSKAYNICKQTIDWLKKENLKYKAQIKQQIVKETGYKTSCID